MRDSEHSAACASCGREVDACAFCDTDECEGRLCHRCVLFTLKESLPHPHEHGG